MLLTYLNDIARGGTVVKSFIKHDNIDIITFTIQELATKTRKTKERIKITAIY